MRVEPLPITESVPAAGAPAAAAAADQRSSSFLIAIAKFSQISEPVAHTLQTRSAQSASSPREALPAEVLQTAFPRSGSSQPASPVTNPAPTQALPGSSNADQAGSEIIASFLASLALEIPPKSQVNDLLGAVGSADTKAMPSSSAGTRGSTDAGSPPGGQLKVEPSGRGSGSKVPTLGMPGISTGAVLNMVPSLPPSLGTNGLTSQNSADASAQTPGRAQLMTAAGGAGARSFDERLISSNPVALQAAGTASIRISAAIALNPSPALSSLIGAPKQAAAADQTSGIEETGRPPHLAADNLAADNLGADNLGADNHFGLTGPGMSTADPASVGEPLAPADVSPSNASRELVPESLRNAAALLPALDVSSASNSPVDPNRGISDALEMAGAFSNNDIHAVGAEAHADPAKGLSPDGAGSDDAHVSSGARWTAPGFAPFHLELTNEAFTRSLSTGGGAAKAGDDPSNSKSLTSLLDGASLSIAAEGAAAKSLPNAGMVPTHAPTARGGSFTAAGSHDTAGAISAQVQMKAAAAALFESPASADLEAKPGATAIEGTIDSLSVTGNPGPAVDHTSAGGDYVPGSSDAALSSSGEDSQGTPGRHVSANELPAPMPGQRFSAGSAIPSGAPSAMPLATGDAAIASPVMPPAVPANSPVSPGAGPARAPADSAAGSSNLPVTHQMLDSAPEAVAAAPPSVAPAAHLADSAALQMHVGIHTSAFGNVDVRTVIEQSQVGISIHGDREFTRWFSSEVGGLETGIKNQHMNLKAVEFSGDRSGVQTATGFQQGQPRQNFPQAAGSYVRASSGDAAQEESGTETDALDALAALAPRAQETRVSILV